MYHEPLVQEEPVVLQPNGPAPYAPPAAVLSIIRRFRDYGLATPFTLDVLIKAGVTESLAPRTFQALKLLDLITEEGQPTEQFRDLSQARSDEYPERLAALVRAAYADVFAFADPSVDDLARIEDAFRGYTPKGQRGRMVTLFLGLCQEAGIVTPEASRRKLTEQTTKPQVRRPKSGTAAAPRSGHRGAGTSALDGVPPALAGLLSELPVPGGSWTRTRRDTFLVTFGSVLDFLYQTRDDTGQEIEEVTDTAESQKV